MKINEIKNYKIFIISITSILLIILGIIFLCFSNGKTNSEKFVETANMENANTSNEEDNPEDLLVVLEEDNTDISMENVDAQPEEDEENVGSIENSTQKNTNGTNNTNNTSNQSPTTYYIKVNYGANVVTIYKKDNNGNCTIPIKAMICSTGTSTPKSGVYSIKNKWTWGKLFGNVWGHYTTKIVGNILFHSVPYLSNDPSTLEYWEYDKLGTSASMGCVRLKVVDAKWIFDNMPYGTPVEFYSDSNPGPLGKPGAQKISGNEQCRGWDPTDPSPNNPWNKITQQSTTSEPVKEEVKKENFVNNTITQTNTNNGNDYNATKENTNTTSIGNTNNTNNTNNTTESTDAKTNETTGNTTTTNENSNPKTNDENISNQNNTPNKEVNTNDTNTGNSEITDNTTSI